LHQSVTTPCNQLQACRQRDSHALASPLKLAKAADAPQFFQAPHAACKSSSGEKVCR
jgi:hypothetical protein